MNPSTRLHAKAQSRKDALIDQAPLLGSAPLRLGVMILLVLLAAPVTSAQEVADTIRVRTRVVFMDALVKDKETGIPITDLKPENFELFDDGKPREISYFTREGQARKPLALIIILDCREDGAGRFLKRPEILKTLADELAKLPPGDEVGIMAMNIGEDEKRVWLTRFTNDRAQVAAAMARVPRFIERPEHLPDEEEVKKSAAQNQKEGKGSITISTSVGDDKSEAKPNATDQAKPKPEDVVETETIKGKNGAVVTRTVLKDGSVNLKRVNSSGKVTLELDDVYDMAAAVRDATRTAAQERPNSQTSIVWVSDGIAPIFYEDRDATEQILIRSNAIFSSLTVDLRTVFKLLLPIGKPLAGWLGVSLYGSAKHLAQQSGGEALRVNRTSDYSAGLAKIIGNLTARYSLGFSLSEAEKDDGRMHELSLRVKASDAKGKTRKLEVSSRRGYFMPKTDGDQTAANQ
ncbi:MAG TPA: VWA domain-containing protein [Pyrinomonadaceae bacterium]|nr:VWA domain-containing protein [Pyrinomonadaceae bacterium]